MSLSPLSSGPLDMHSHLMFGVDDGCQSLQQTLACIAQLKAAGFAGSICTPHMISKEYPDNTPAAMAGKIVELRQAIAEAGEDYPLWIGGELTMRTWGLDWLHEHGVPTLGQSRYVLTDFWGDQWPAWLIEAYGWLVEQGYQPILAHPERMPVMRTQPEGLKTLEEMGIVLQGNLASFARAEDDLIRQTAMQLLEAGRYQLLATDLHRPTAFEACRLQGLANARQAVGQEAIGALLVDMPRRILGLTPGA